MKRYGYIVGSTFLAVALAAAPSTVLAGDKTDQMKDKAKTATQETKAAVSDSWLTSKTKIALFADDRVKGSQVKVETEKAVVHLTGKVDSDTAKMAAAEIAQGIDGVKSVKNDLQVVAPSKREAVASDDKQIAKAVESRLSRDSQLKKIDVKTDAGVVVLTGKVPTITASAKASEMARGVPGVKSVKNELTYTQ